MTNELLKQMIKHLVTIDMYSNHLLFLQLFLFQIQKFFICYVLDLILMMEKANLKITNKFNQGFEEPSKYQHTNKYYKITRIYNNEEDKEKSTKDIKTIWMKH